MQCQCSAVYVDVESQGRNEVKPSQTSPGGGQSKVPGGEEREKIPTSETNTVRVFGFCHLGGQTTITVRAGGDDKAAPGGAMKCGY